MNRERVLLVTRFVIVTLCAAVIGFMLVRAWEPRTVAYWYMYRAAILFDFGPGLAVVKFASTVIGLYVGALLLFTLDWRKRVQGVLLFAGSAVVLLVLNRFDVLVPHIQPTPANGAFFIGGVVAALATQFRSIQRQFSRQTPFDELEFDGAILAVFALFTLVPLVGLAQSLLAGTSIILLDLPVTGAFVYTVLGFITYDSTINTAVLGPQSSGKTMMILGLFQRFTARDDTPVRATSTLNHLVYKADRMEQGEDFPAAHTIGTDNEIGFYFQVGELFPMQARFSTLDHAGELIDDIAVAVDGGALVRDRLMLISYWIQDRLPFVELSSEAQQELFYQHIRDASIVILAIDVQRLIDGDKPYLDELQTIAGELNDRNATIRIVATKCDLLLDEFTSQSRIIDDPERDGVLYADGDADYTSFSEWVTSFLTGKSTQVQNLMKETDDDIIYPIWFRTIEKNGTRVPALDEDGNLQPAGFDVLVDELEEEALRNV